jgi:ATP-dependent DNA helicase RecQ
MLREAAPGTRVRASRAKSRRGDLAPRAETKPADAPLQAALRARRVDIARQRSVPAYVVLHDSTIDGIAAARPSTLNELRNIPGIGDKKLEHYGDELLALVRSADA